ncbi:MAG: hypothetical protein ABIP63_02185, partial [Thermoanaerobaculia bacterium]
KRLRLPRAGKLPKLLSPELTAFVAALPRPAKDPLGERCQPVDRNEVALYHSRVDRILPLWQSQAGATVMCRVWSKSEKSHVEFALLSEGRQMPQSLARTEQGLIGRVLVETLLYRSDRKVELVDQLRNVAKEMGFRHFDEIVKWSAGRRLRQPTLAAGDDEASHSAESDQDDDIEDFIAAIDERS